MYKRLITIVLTLCCLSTGGQSQSTQHEGTLSNLIISADSIKRNVDGSSCVAFIRSKSEMNLHDTVSLGVYYYNLAICYTIMNQVDSACYYLQLAMGKWSQLNSFIYIDRDFLKLYGTPCWDRIIQRIDSSFLSNYPTISNNKLAVDLYHILLSDQQLRGLRIKSVTQSQDSIDLVNLQRVEEIINEHGWPTYSLVGETAAKGAFLVIQHSNIQVQQKYLKLIFDAAMNNEASKEWVALLMDRISVIRRGVQIFGTQVYQVVDSTNMKVRIYKYFPIRDEHQVDSLRKEFNMIPLKEYYERYGITYCPLTK